MSSCIKSDLIIIILLKLSVNNVPGAIVSHNSLNVIAQRKRGPKHFKALSSSTLFCFPPYQLAFFAIVIATGK